MIGNREKSHLEQVVDEIVWKPDRALLGDLVFRLQQVRDENWDMGDQAFVLIKGRYMVGKYRDLFARNPQLRVENMLELGIFQGGSIALWRELLEPKKMAAIDFADPPALPYLDSYVERMRGKTDFSIYWNFDQGDKPRLHKLVAEDLDGKLDMVIDDAGHMYDSTLASFEALFPLVRPGGVYIIEDWSWNHWEDHMPAGHPWAGLRSLSEIIFQLVEGVGGMTIGVEHIEANRWFVALFRDDTVLPADFSLPKCIRRRPQTDYDWWKGKGEG